MFHGLHRQVHSRHVSRFARPQARRIHYHLGVDDALGRRHIPAAIRALARGHYRRMREILRAIYARGLRIGVHHTRRIHIAVDGVPQGSDVVLGVNERVATRHFLDADELLIETHVAGLGAFTLEVVVPNLVRGQIEPARGVQADGVSGGRFNLLVEIDGVALQTADVGVGADGVDLAGRMPTRATGQFITFQQHAVLPTKLGKMEQDGSTHDTAADDDDLGMGRQGIFHGNLLHGGATRGTCKMLIEMKLVPSVRQVCFAARHEVFQRLAARRVQRRRFVFREQAVPALIGTPRRILGTLLFPLFDAVRV